MQLKEPLNTVKRLPALPKDMHLNKGGRIHVCSRDKRRNPLFTRNEAIVTCADCQRWIENV